MFWQAALASNLLLSVSSVSGSKFQPAAVDYGKLMDIEAFHGDAVGNVLEKALVTDGIVQVANIPGFAALRQRTLLEAHSCIARAPNAQSVVLPDASTRRTLAAVSSATLGQMSFDFGSESEECRAFEKTSQRFRQSVNSITDVFAARLDLVLGLEKQSNSGLLHRKSGEGESLGDYRNLEEIVKAGERLEHFHSYKVPERLTSSQTIDFHVDQGLFIAFVPAMLAESPSAEPASAGAFLMRSPDGREEYDVELQPDAVVFLLGDGVNQYLNDRHSGPQLHAPTHALRIPQKWGLHRVWYGMMQLPPMDATVNEKSPTFGEIRDMVNRASAEGPAALDALALGCSRKLQARELVSTCSASQVYCWHRCMDFTAEASPDVCASQNKGFNCTSQFDQIYRAQDGHGDYNLKCTNSKSFVAPRPVVAQPTGSCTGFAAMHDDAAYAHRIALVPDETSFLWNVKGDEIEGKMIHNGLVGWLAIGTGKISGGSHSPMNGGSVVMGLNDPDAGPSIGEYRIHERHTAWRHWKTPLSPTALTDASMAVTSCYTSIAFKTKSIYGVPLNVTSGSNLLIWALTRLGHPTQEYGGYAPYHAPADLDRALRFKYRGNVTLDFAGHVAPGRQDEQLSTAASRRLPVVAVVSAVLLLLRALQ